MFKILHDHVNDVRFMRHYLIRATLKLNDCFDTLLRPKVITTQIRYFMLVCVIRVPWKLSFPRDDIPTIIRSFPNINEMLIDCSSHLAGEGRLEIHCHGSGSHLPHRLPVCRLCRQCGNHIRVPSRQGVLLRCMKKRSLLTLRRSSSSVHEEEESPHAKEFFFGA